MEKLIDFVIFVFVAGLLWWGLTAILEALSVPSPFDRLAVIGFVILAALAFIDFLKNGKWFWNRPR